jgi:hypothetical protein
MIPRENPSRVMRQVISALYGDVERFEHRDGFGERFFIFGERVAVGDDAAADWDVDVIAFGNHCADGDVELHGAIGGQITDRAAVGAAADGFQFFDDLHCADFRCAGDRSAGESGSQQIDEVHILAEFSFYGGGTVIHRRVHFDCSRLGHFYRADFTNSAKVVPLEIDNHVQLGLVFYALEKFFCHAGPAGARAFYRAGRDGSIGG